jgi:hypothetical protein
MTIEAKQANKITVSFSANVGTKGIKQIKNYIEFLELNASATQISQKNINILAKDVTAAAWQNLKQKKQL